MSHLGGAVSEMFLAASRMIPGDYESWHVEWMRTADRNWARGIEAEKAVRPLNEANLVALRI